MKAGWVTKPFEQCIERVTYTKKIQRKDFLAEGSYPIVSQEDDFINGYWDNPADLFKISKPVILFGDHTKSLKYVDFDFVLGADGVKILQPANFLEPRFFFYFLQSVNLNSLGYARHYKLLRELQISYPGLAEQQRIVAILDQAFEGIAKARANAEKNLQNARALFESHLEDVFTKRGEGWVEKKLEQIGVTQTGSTPKTIEKENFGNFIPFIKPADFNVDGSLNYENDGLSEQGLKFARRIDQGSVLMVCIGTLGKCGWCERSVTTNQQINSLTPVNGVSYKFIYYQMLTENFQQRVIYHSAQTTLPIINKTKWSGLKIWLPPSLTQQELIVAELDSLREKSQRLESLYQRKIAALDDLKQSLLHQAFSGQLPDKI